MTSRPPTSACVILRELDRRISDGLEVTLDWNQANGDVWLGVHDRRAETYTYATVAPERALHAVRHPFAYVEATA